MGYKRDLKKSARRHFEAAELLMPKAPRGRPDVAGYLYGVAAECALKKIMWNCGVRPLAEAQRYEDPFYAHFPRLKELLGDSIQGRRGGQLRPYVENKALMNEWSTEMRYASGDQVLDRNVQRWREQARDLLRAMEE